MYQKSAVQCERLFNSTGYIVNKTHSSLEAKTVNMPCAWVVGYPSTFEWENACANYCFN